MMAMDSNTWNNLVDVLEDKITTLGNQIVDLNYLEDSLNLPSEEYHLSQEQFSMLN